MPLTWVDPEVFMTYRDVTVYHVYRHDDMDGGAREYWYGLTKSCTDDGENSFDVRTLPGYRDEDQEADYLRAWDNNDVKAAIAHAIDSGYFDNWEKDEPDPEREHRRKYPEHTKLQQLTLQRDTINQFLDWLAESGLDEAKPNHRIGPVRLAFYPYIVDNWKGDPIPEEDQERSSNLEELYTSREDLIAAFLGIDRNKLEDEKRAMLEFMARTPEQQDEHS